jgi:hypothetical protein
MGNSPVKIPDAKQTAATVTAGPTEVGSYAPFVDALTDFTFDYPEGWIAYAQDPDADAVLRVAMAYHHEAGAFVSVQQFVPPGEISDEDYEELKRGIEEAWLKAFEDLAFVSRWENLNMVGLDGLRATISGAQKGKKMVSTWVYVLGAENMYLLVAQATEDTWPANQAAFNRFFSSFKLQNQGE